MKRNLIIFVIALPFIISLAFLIATKRPAQAPDKPLPNPNGYEQFLAAAGMLQVEAQPFETMSEDELTALVTNNTEALALVQSAFSNECRVPVQYTVSYTTSNHSKDFIAFRYLARIMAAKGRLAELQNHPAEAAQDYLDVIHFGTEAGRGGFLVDAMIGIAIEGLAQSYLTNLVYSLDAASCRAAAATLESLDLRRQDLNDALDRDNILRHRLAPGLKNYFTIWWYMHKQMSETKNNAEKAFYEKQKDTRSLAMQFAARAYKLDKGKPPTSIADLVPSYLKAIPKDPTTGKDMVFPP